MDQTEHLDIVVTAQEAQTIRHKVESGAYSSASDLMRAALRALEQKEAEAAEQMDALRRKLQASIDDPRPALTLDEVFERLDRHIAERQLQFDGKK